MADSFVSDPSVSDRWGKRLVAAPMMGRTDATGCAYLRQVLPQALLFTEMIPAAALVHGGARAHARLQEYFDWQEALPSKEGAAESATSSATSSAQEAQEARQANEARETIEAQDGGLVLQLGGADPALLGEASALASAYPFCELNLNLGCPSPRVTKGGFGACLIEKPALAARLVAAMKEGAGGVPVSVKTRIGLKSEQQADENDEERLHAFVDALCAAGCDTLYLHARKAWLKGVSAKENRSLPPLKPEVVRRLQAARPSLPVVYNGGVQNIDEAETFLASFAGVMVGRALWRSPCGFAGKREAERPRWRNEIAEKLLSAIDRALSRSLSRSSSRSSSCFCGSSRLLSPRLSRRLVFRGAARLSRRAMSLYHGEPDAGEWRRKLQRAFESLKVAEKTRLDSLPRKE